MKSCFHTSTTELKPIKYFFKMANIKPEIKLTNDLYRWGKDAIVNGKLVHPKLVGVRLTEKDFQKAICKKRIDNWHKLHLTGTSPETLAELLHEVPDNDYEGPY